MTVTSSFDDVLPPPPVGCFGGGENSKGKFAMSDKSRTQIVARYTVQAKTLVLRYVNKVDGGVGR